MHRANLDEHVMLGMHAIIYDGLVGGDEPLVAAGCVVLSSTEIPRGKMVIGAPRWILSDVSAEQKAAWDWGTKVYDALAGRCKTVLRSV